MFKRGAVRCLSFTVVLMLSACGFHLRGSYQSRFGVNSVFVASGDLPEQVQEDLSQAFVDRGISILPSAVDEVPIVNVIGFDQGVKLESIDPGSQQAHYEVYVDVKYNVLSVWGSEYMPKQTLRVAQQYPADVAKSFDQQYHLSELYQKLYQSMSKRWVSAVLSPIDKPKLQGVA